MASFIYRTFSAWFRSRVLDIATEEVDRVEFICLLKFLEEFDKMEGKKDANAVHAASLARLEQLQEEKSRLDPESFPVISDICDKGYFL